MTLPHSTDIFKYPARFQFGESTAPCGGSSCCTDTCIKMIVEYYKEQTHPLAEIRKRAQAKTNFNEGPCTGLNHVEVLNALSYYGLSHYTVSFGADAQKVFDKVKIGPVIVGVHYGSYPEWEGKCGAGPEAEIGGKTDCSFTGAHAVLAIGGRFHVGRGHRDIYVRDPDHNSPSRPEKPAYDRIRKHQLNVAMQNLPKYTKFSDTYIIYPTKRKVL